MLQRIFSKNKCNDENNLYRLDRYKIRKIKKLLDTTVKRNGRLLITDGIMSDGNDVFVDFILNESSSEEEAPVPCKESIPDFLIEISGIVEFFITAESETLNIEIHQNRSGLKWVAEICVKYPNYFTPVKDSDYAGM